MGQHLVVDHAGVGPDRDLIDREHRDLGDHDPAQRVGQGVVDVVERELEVVRPRGEDFDVHGRGERGRGREGNRKVASVLLFLRC